MQNRISALLACYDHGEISRRDVVSALAALALAPGGARAASTLQGVEVNHVALNVTNVARSRDFYQEHLGLPVVNQGPRHCFLGMNRGFLALFEGSDPGMDHFCIGIEDYEAGHVRAEIERQGLDPSRRQDRVYFHDPDGIEIQLSAAGHRPVSAANRP